jgi:hypothetical protein
LTIGCLQFVSSLPEATGDKIIIGYQVLKVGETKEIRMMAIVSAPLNSIQNISGTMTFKPENLNADFNQKVSVDLGVNSSVLVMTIEGTEKVLANKNTEYIVTLKNIGSDVLKDIEVTAEFPKGFIAASSTPDAKDGFNNVWTIDKIATSTSKNSTSTERQIKKEEIIQV